MTFVGSLSEAKLLADGYALEQATNVRLAPSFTNPSMWRCVPGSTFFTAELCHPGDPQLAPNVVLTNLSTQIGGLGINKVLALDLQVRLKVIIHALDSDPVSCRLLDDFAALVSHESGGRLSPAQAASIIGTATGVEDHLGCTDPS